MALLWQGWRRPRSGPGFARAPWERLPGACGTPGAVYTHLMDGELVGGAGAYDYCAMPEGQRPDPDTGTYRTRVMRPGF